MEDIKLKKLLAKTNYFIERHHNKDDVTSYKKDNLISNLDAKLGKLITNDEELVQEVCEAEDIKKSLSHNRPSITRVQKLNYLIVPLQGNKMNAPLEYLQLFFVY